MGLSGSQRPIVLMLLDDQDEADAIVAELRRSGRRVAVRFLPTGEVPDHDLDGGIAAGLADE
jgi:hypothetical protein